MKTHTDTKAPADRMGGLQIPMAAQFVCQHTAMIPKCTAAMKTALTGANWSRTGLRRVPR
jgi:hypothetical protein